MIHFTILVFPLSNTMAAPVPSHLPPGTPPSQSFSKNLILHFSFSVSNLTPGAVTCAASVCTVCLQSGERCVKCLAGIRSNPGVPLTHLLWKKWSGSSSAIPLCHARSPPPHAKHGFHKANKEQWCKRSSLSLVDIYNFICTTSVEIVGKDVNFETLPSPTCDKTAL